MTSNTAEPRIVLNPQILCGKPVIQGTRLSVEFVVDLLAQGWSFDQVIDNYPGVTEPDLLACLHYAAELLRSERVYPIPV